MLLGGDEIGRTQQGNNNAYCQDNEISWFDWDATSTNVDLLELHPPADRAAPRAPGVPPPPLLPGPADPRRGVSDIGWFAPTASEMTDEDWDDGFAKSLGRVPQRRRHRDADERGRAGRRRLFLLLFNARRRGRRLHPAAATHRRGRGTRRRHDTRRSPTRTAARAGRRTMVVPARSSVVARAVALTTWPDDARRRAAPTYRLQLHPGFGFDDAAGPSPTTSRDLGVSHLYLSPSCRPRRAARTATTSSTTPGSTPSSAATTATAACSRRSTRRRPGPAARHRAQPHGHRPAGQPLVVGRARERAGQLVRRLLRHRLGPAGAQAAPRVLLPILGDHYGRGPRGRRAAARATTAGRSSSATTTTRSRSRPARSTTSCAEAAAARRRRTSWPSGRRARRIAACTPSRTDRPRRVASATATRRCSLGRLDAPVHGDAGGGGGRRRRARGGQRRRRRASTPCSSARTTGWPSGGRPARSSTTAGSSTSTTLVGLRVEDDEVFDDTHRLVLVDWRRRGVVDGLRIDHVDGLRDPAGYLRPAAAAPHRTRGSWSRRSSSAGEALPRRGRSPARPATTSSTWSAGCSSTRPARRAMTDAYRRFTGERRRLRASIVRGGQAARSCRRRWPPTSTGSPGCWPTSCEGHRRYRDFTRRELRDGLREVLAAFPVYRTYVRAERGRQPTATDVPSSTRPSRRARRATAPDLDGELLAFLGRCSCCGEPGPRRAELARAASSS